MKFVFLCLAILFFGFSALASNLDQKEALQQFLKEFHLNPERMYQKLPPEIRNGKVIDRGFINYEKLDRRLLEEKEKLRSEIKVRSNPSFAFFSVPSVDDNAASLVDGGIVVSNIKELDRQGLASFELPEMLWSDDYWAYSKGLIANRYADPANPKAKTDWNSNYAYFVANPTSVVTPDNLSPAEKYDLLLGDPNMTLTNYSWARGRSFNEQNGGMVPGWMGICHGWSAANHLKTKIPYGSVVLKAPNGAPIRFYQSDVKALITALWAFADIPTRFLGFRCDQLPPKDGQGREVDEKCRDNNPATVFLTLTNQLAMNKRPFVMDGVYDAEVWNFTIVSYESIYFNPQNFKQTDNLMEAVVPVGQYTIDKFKKYRAPNTAFVVGVNLNLTHLTEVGPSHGVQVKPATQTKQYVMDLELDANYNIIGGEWYTIAHPDFLWSYAPDAQALAPGDVDIAMNDWNVSAPVPSTWTAAAQKSSKEGMPLRAVLKKIVDAAPSNPNTSNE